ncbi:MAG: CHASE2 domain-containing protein [Leptolyngbyaceae cyanobacterium SM2_3_12]|nr:CHASE2 domain-containing protein [Leptolyngbyaceae cyanobacterium SM2_3_12]
MEVPPPPTVPMHRVGFNDFPTDSDGIIRRNLIFVRSQEGGFYSFALRVVLAFHRASPLVVRAEEHHLYLGQTALEVLSGQAGGYQAVDNRGYQILLRYRHPSSLARQISISQVLSGQFEPSWIANQIVLVGTTAPSLKDQFYTPFSFNQDQNLTMPGVAIHAQMISQLLDAIAGKPALYQFFTPLGENWPGCGRAVCWRQVWPGG